ncbi:MAG TPA: hypothetical protein VNY36_06925, partial [Bacteroidia bacterium]|nr:hypothetical protein [Bacteroidia bacterium]
MNKRILSVSAAILYFFLTSNAQSDWASMMRNPKANVHDVQKAFNQWYSNQKPDSGDNEENGISLYKRWEWMMNTRTFPTGNRPDETAIATDYQNYLSHTRSTHRMMHGTSANWTYVGNTSVPNHIPSDGNIGGDGRVNRMRFFPGNNNIMYACAPTGGLWKSTNDGASWVTNTDNLGDLAT